MFAMTNSSTKSQLTEFVSLSSFAHDPLLSAIFPYYNISNKQTANSKISCINKEKNKYSVNIGQSTIKWQKRN